ncbi:hypothetical protein MRX96_012900 [Rhipicephalus microplus]
MGMVATALALEHVVRVVAKASILVQAVEVASEALLLVQGGGGRGFGTGAGGGDVDRSIGTAAGFVRRGVAAGEQTLEIDAGGGSGDGNKG